MWFWSYTFWAMAKLSKADLKEAIQTIYAAMVEGDSDEDAAASMGLTAEEFAPLKAAMFDAKADEIRARPTEHTYVQYMIDQAQNIRDLTAMVDEFKTSKQYNAMVGAIKARGDIYDKLIKFGQEFGLIHKEASKGHLLVGHIIADMSNKQLKTAITGELLMLNGLVKKYGDGNIIDMDPGDIHHGPKLPKALAESSLIPESATHAPPPNKKRTAEAKKTARAKNNKRHAGRVRVRG